MSQFRKKPVVIEAVQLLWTTWNEMCDFLGDRFFEEGGSGCFINPETGEADVEQPNISRLTALMVRSAGDPDIGLLIPILEGTMLGRQGDWIIKEPFATDDRCFYPCKPDIFEATYEPVTA